MKTEVLMSKQQLKITTVVISQNGMVLVFDQWGEQMPEYQGRFEKVHDKILMNSDNDVEFYARDWQSQTLTPLEYFFPPW
jgi:hypothetical protein